MTKWNLFSEYSYFHIQKPVKLMENKKTYNLIKMYKVIIRNFTKAETEMNENETTLIFREM